MIGDKTRIALLPLYLELYDEVAPEAKERMAEFVETISAGLAENGLDVLSLPVCRVEGEFKSALAEAEGASVDALVTLHLAYSPSLESIDALTSTELPIIVLDTTPGADFAPGTDPAELMFNHGIHGVQDMCNMLLRAGKQFLIEAGHWRNSDVLERVARDVKSAGMASAFRRSRVGRVGEPFKGMGDFIVEPEVFKRLGITTIPTAAADIAALMPDLDSDEVSSELAEDLKRFDVQGVSELTHRRSVAAGLAVRKWIERDELSAFTINFLAVDRASGLQCVPFLEASKAMARGVGYAGEGDVLTAALVGAVASAFTETTFTEMFCPDWENGTIFMSHMGEMNCDLTAGKARLIEKDWIFSDAEAPVVAVGCFKSGEAVLANLAPGPEGTFTLILAPVDVVEGGADDKHVESVRGWIKPRIELKDFLAEYSLFGGTHHSAMVYGGGVDELANFAVLMGWEYAIIE